ncbi:MAG: hypothetical protein LBB89_11725 [Treponema sp.]|nr:hypothetical protein [Treponema sp.]
MANKKNGLVLLKKGLWFHGKTKSFLSLSIVVSILVLVFSSCASPAPIRPALSQTVINIQRSATKLDTGKLYIYVDDRCINRNAPILKGQFISYPVNNGVHYIHGICGKYVSEAINFSANSNTVSFVAEIVKESGAFGKTKLVINRGEVSDDTGRQTNLDIQESYGNK